MNDYGPMWTMPDMDEQTSAIIESWQSEPPPQEPRFFRVSQGEFLVWTGELKHPPMRAVLKREEP